MSGDAEKGGAAEGFAGRTVGWLGAYLISFIGLVYLLVSGEHFGYAAYLGVLFLANFALSAVAAVGIVWTGRRWAWSLGDLIAGVSLVGFVVSRTAGLPGYPEAIDEWFDFPGWVCMILELSYLALSLLVLTPQGRALVAAEQRRIDHEGLPPARQETPEHFGLLEEEMREIRDRMATDVKDLRAHLDPRTLKERTEWGARRRLRALLPGQWGGERR